MILIQSISKRILIIIFWLSVICAVLFMPTIISYFQEDRAINIMTWTELIDLKKIKEFETKTGIKVHLSYYDTNEEFYIRFRASEGKGYDIVIPSDYVIEWLRRDKLLKPLDKKKLTILDRIHPRLTHQFYDPHDEYALPYSWVIFGLGVNTAFFNNSIPESWSLIFDAYVPRYKIAAPNVARELVCIAAQYMYHSIDELTNTQLSEIKNLLIAQKKWVEAYTELRTDYLLTSGSCPVVVSLTPLMKEVIENNEELAFITPREGTFSIVDCIVIPKHTQKDDLIYSFINFLYSKEIIEYHFNKFRFFPATIDLIPLFQKYNVDYNIQRPYIDESIPLDYMRNVISEHTLHEIWISLLSASI